MRWRAEKIFAPSSRGDGGARKLRSKRSTNKFFSKRIEGCGLVTVRRGRGGHWQVDWEPDEGEPFSLSRTNRALPLNFPLDDDPRELLWWAERYFSRGLDTAQMRRNGKS